MELCRFSSSEFYIGFLFDAFCYHFIAVWFLSIVKYKNATTQRLVNRCICPALKHILRPVEFGQPYCRINTRGMF
jgi:hypothetical protein